MALRNPSPREHRQWVVSSTTFERYFAHDEQRTCTERGGSATCDVLTPDSCYRTRSWCTIAIVTLGIRILSTLTERSPCALLGRRATWRPNINSIRNKLSKQAYVTPVNVASRRSMTFFLLVSLKILVLSCGELNEAPETYLQLASATLNEL